MPSPIFSKKDLQTSAIILSVIGITLIIFSTLDYLFALKTLEYSRTNGEIIILKKEKEPRGGYYYVLE